MEALMDASMTYVWTSLAINACMGYVAFYDNIHINIANDGGNFDLGDWGGGDFGGVADLGGAGGGDFDIGGGVDVDVGGAGDLDVGGMF